MTGLRDPVEPLKDQEMDKKQKKFMDSEKEVLRIIKGQLQYTKEYQEMSPNSAAVGKPPAGAAHDRVIRRDRIAEIQDGISMTSIFFVTRSLRRCFPTRLTTPGDMEKEQQRSMLVAMKQLTCLLLIYEDDGVGIPHERKKELFVRGAGPATGFSLYFIHDILEISDMTIRETGGPGTGGTGSKYPFPGCL